VHLGGEVLVAQGAVFLQLGEQLQVEGVHVRRFQFLVHDGIIFLGIEGVNENSVQNLI
jgi:hypothetical protein